MPGAGDLGDELVGGGELLGGHVELVLGQRGQATDLIADRAHVGHRVGDVPGSGLPLGTDHGRALGDAAQRLTQVGGSAHERNGEGLLVDVVGVVGRGEDLGLVDVVHAEALEDLGLHEVTDTGLGHDRDGDRLDDAGDEVGVAHAGDAALGSDVGGDALERHDGDGSSVLGDTGLLGRDDVHDDASLEHVRHAAFDGEGAGAGSGLLCTQSWSSGREPRPPHGAAATSPRKC